MDYKNNLLNPNKPISQTSTSSSMPPDQLFDKILLLTQIEHWISDHSNQLVSIYCLLGILQHLYQPSFNIIENKIISTRSQLTQLLLKLLQMEMKQFKCIQWSWLDLITQEEINLEKKKKKKK